MTLQSFARLEFGAASKTSDNLQRRSSCEDMISATFSAIVKREIWTQTVEDANNAVQLSKRIEDAGNLRSCNGILDSKPAYSSFKIQQGDFQGLTIPTVLSNEKQTESLPETLPWYRDHSVLKTSEISPPSTVGQQGISAPGVITTSISPPTTMIEMPSQNVIRGPRIPLISETNRNESSDICSSGCQNGSPDKRQGIFMVTSPAASTTCLPSTDLQADLSADVSTHLKHQLALATNPAISTSVATSNLNELSVTPQLTPLKLHQVMSPTGLPNSKGSEPTTMRTTTTGTQYQIEKQPSAHLPPIPTPPMHEELSCCTPTTTSRRVDLSIDHDGLFSSTPEPRHYQDSTTSFRAQEQALPFHKGDFQSPFPDGDELVPEPLADSVKMEAGPLLSIIDVHQVECLYSKHWQLREKALQFLIDKLNTNKLVEEPVPYFRMMNKVLLRTLNDRVANVFNTSLQLLRTVVTTYASTVPHRDLHISSSGFTAILLEKLGDLNARTKEGSFETLMFLASKKEIGIHVLSGPLLKLPKNQGIWRPVLGRLQLLLHAVPLYGIQPPSRTGFPSDALMNFVTQAFNSPNGEVRNAAIKVTTEVYRLMGPPIDKYLKGIKPLIREILTSNFERVAYESEQGDDTYYQERTLSADEPGRSTTRGQNIGLRPLVQDQIEEHEFIDNKGHEINASFSKTEGSPTRSSLSGQEQKVEELETRVVEAESHTKDSPSYSHAETTAKVQETGWVDSQQSSSPVEEMGDVVDETEAACESVRSHCSDGEASLDTSTRPPQNADDFPMEKDENVDSCLFCGKQDARFKEGDNLDLHFCEQCPMLASCSNCGQIVEISSLKDHYLFECASGKRYIECQKCYLAVPESRLAAHQKSKDCKMCKQHKLLRCPLCYRTVEPSDKGWREHILQLPGCLRNPRTLIHAS
ncbi:hypothetical protein M758_11G166900 [Ceratodon purpureus]|nr:hypothetical protein M758_11G166900 [Ceratodon purpureus]